MTTKLSDLRVIHDQFDVVAVNKNTRSAATSDLVEALREVGGREWNFREDGVQPEPGRYLVVPLGEDACKHDWYRSADAPPDTCLKCGATKDRG